MWLPGRPRNLSSLGHIHRGPPDKLHPGYTPRAWPCPLNLPGCGERLSGSTQKLLPMVGQRTATRHTHGAGRTGNHFPCFSPLNLVQGPPWQVSLGFDITCWPERAALGVCRKTSKGQDAGQEETKTAEGRGQVESAGSAGVSCHSQNAYSVPVFVYQLPATLENAKVFSVS